MYISKLYIFIILCVFGTVVNSKHTNDECYFKGNISINYPLKCYNVTFYLVQSLDDSVMLNITINNTANYKCTGKCSYTNTSKYPTTYESRLVANGIQKAGIKIYGYQRVDNKHDTKKYKNYNVIILCLVLSMFSMVLLLVGLWNVIFGSIKYYHKKLCDSDHQYILVF